MVSFWVFAGCLLDIILGDPWGWPHPVRWIGSLIDSGMKFIFSRDFSPTGQKVAGLGLTIGLLAVVWGISWAALLLADLIWAPLAYILGAWMVWTSLSLKDLVAHVRAVQMVLGESDPEKARAKLAMIVGRETADLDRIGVIRAGLETLAENLSDGVVAPLFFILLGGPAAGLAYKTVNTLDSMVGYKHEPYTHLGYFPAKLDDLVNWIPARLTGLLVVLGALIRGLDWRAGWTVMVRDHGLSASPNAGWPEAALAGALHISLLGPAIYAGQVKDKEFINKEAPEPDLSGFAEGVELIWTTGLVSYLLGLGIIYLTN